MTANCTKAGRYRRKIAALYRRNTPDCSACPVHASVYVEQLPCLIEGGGHHALRDLLRWRARRRSIGRPQLRLRASGALQGWLRSGASCLSFGVLSFWILEVWIDASHER